MTHRNYPSLRIVKETLIAVILLGALFFAISPTANAQITLTFHYDGTDTVSTYNVATGTFAGQSLTQSGASFTEMGVFMGARYSNGSGTADYYSSGAVASSPPWGDGGADSSTGDTFGFNLSPGGGVYLPVGYDITSGAALTGTITWNNTSLTDLGFSTNSADSGSFSAPFSSTVNWSTTASAVPEVSSFAMIAGLLSLGFVASRRRLRVTR